MFKIKRSTILISMGVVIILLSSLQKSLPASSDIASKKLTKHIIIDAGHGFPDGGAVGISGTIESTINIKLAKKAAKLLSKAGYKVTLTRKGENSLAEDGQTISQKKKDDMHKRLDIINKSDADVFISIHMNKFTDSRNRGAQVLYSHKFPQAALLAEKIQKELCEIPDNIKKRTALRGSDKIFLLSNSNVPAVIVECGFLSNFEEEKRLNSEKYQAELAAAIADGVKNYYNSLKSHSFPYSSKM